jgi:hypothetical protein
VTLRNKRVRVANAKLADDVINRDVELRYEIVATATGSLLRLFNRPEDETFQVEVMATLTTDVGSGAGTESVTFEGVKYEYPREFYLARNECMYHVDPDRFPTYKVQLSPDDWRRVPEERFVEVQQLLATLGDLRSQRSERRYGQALTALADLTGVASAHVEVVALDERIELPRQAEQPELMEPQRLRYRAE